MSICLGIHCFSFVCFFSSFFSFRVTGFCLRSQCKWLLWGNPPYSSCAWDKQHTFEQLCCIHTSFYYNSSLYFCCFSQCANLHLASVTGPVILENLCRFFKGDWHWRLFWGESGSLWEGIKIVFCFCIDSCTWAECACCVLEYITKLSCLPSENLVLFIAKASFCPVSEIKIRLHDIYGCEAPLLLQLQGCQMITLPLQFVS